MNEINQKKTSISKANTLEDIADFWDTHSLDDYWDQTHEVEFKVRAKRRRRIVLDPEVYAKIEETNSVVQEYERILVTSALPYANGPIHLGHLAGAYLPADVYVRYQRLKGRDVVFICGTDEHGVPITIKAEKQGITPQQLVDHYWADHKDTFARLGITFDNFSRTSLPVHHQTSKKFFKALYDSNYFVRKYVKQFYCTKCNRFLADRFVEGKCPKCGAEGARGDQCESCGSSIEQTELINPYCKVCGSPPELRETFHLFLKLSDFQGKLESWLSTKKNWKENVLNYCRGWFKEGLIDRAVTRDLSWGVPVPVEGYENKVMYVWFEAPIGYVSSTIEWAENQGKPDLWKKYWLDPASRLVHFIGKDNIIFHAIVWPAMLMAHGEFVLPADIPANEFLNIEGQKLSTSKNYAVWLGEYLEKFPPDPLRYWLAVNAPETKDADFSWRDFQHRNNNELADIVGNFFNRTLTFAEKNFNAQVPEPGDLDQLDELMLKTIANAPSNVGELLERFELRKAVTKFMDVARFANKYFNDQEPWLSVKDNKTKCATTIHICLQAVKTMATLMEPFMPFSAERTWSMLDLPGSVHSQNWNSAHEVEMGAGHKFGKIEILFEKIEDEKIEPEISRLQRIAADFSETVTEERMPEIRDNISFDDFKKVDLRIAKILTAEHLPKTDKLLRMDIEIGDERRQIIAGVAETYTAEELAGRLIVVVANLEPAKIRGVESNGMLLAAVDAEGKAILLAPDKEVATGAQVT